MRSFNTICLACSKYQPNKDVVVGILAKSTCTAFPNGIPDEIWFDGFDHRVPFRGETNLFELAQGKQALLSRYEERKEMLAELDEVEELPPATGPRRPPIE